MKLEQWKTEKLVDYARNPRKNDHGVDRLAAAIKEFGFRVPIVAKSDGLVVDGHMRLKAAKKLGMETVPVLLADDMTDAQVKAFRLSVNKMAELADWDVDLLALELAELGELGLDVSVVGFDDDELAALLNPEKTEGLTDPDDVPGPPTESITKPGDVWLLGEHRVMCGDSTKAEDVERLMGGKSAQLIHADPPYGMGKEKDGVQNDNLCHDKLDAFQMAWWRAFRPHTDDNSGVYIWGNAEDLWRLWYVGGLKDSERLTFRNEIVWDKSYGHGMESDQHRMFPTVSERCLFFMLGEQGFNSNADNYWEGWEPIRAYLDGERVKSGLTTAQCNEICGKQNMTQSAFTRGGFRLILKEDYEKLQAACNGKAFKREHDELKREHDELKREFYATRAYFDNTHESMTDVWEFPRVTGEERHGHATPKPAAMMVRAVKSSCPGGGIVAEPFGGSGSTLMGAEQSGRVCYAMEIGPQYCDVIVKRWQDFTGKKATHEKTGKAFD